MRTQSRVFPRLSLLLVPAVACSGTGTGAEPPGVQPQDWDRDIAPRLATDVDPDPHVFETTIVARVEAVELSEGVFTELWTYDGSLPGPEIRVEQGDRLIVHLENQLPEATTVHWHGLRLPNGMDGVPAETQSAIEPGETFTYDFVVPDAGLYWYHPHVRSAAQVGFGMYGTIVVTDPEEPPDLGDELTLVLSDVSLDSDGALVPADSSGELGTLFGREGNVLLVNGKVSPVLHARSGRRQRWRVVNASRTRYYQLGAAGHGFTRIGGDGGLAEHPVETPTLILAPGERADAVIALSGEPGAELPVQWIPTEHGYGSTFGRKATTIFRVAFSDDEPYVDEPLPSVSRVIEPLDTTGATPQEFQLTRGDDALGNLVLGINGVPSWDASPVMAAIGETQVWTVTNTFDFAHPFHLHGFFFQVLSLNDVAPAVLEWKDTADVPVDGTLRLAVKFDERPGMWMFHCHILDHADAGMMGMVHLHETEPAE